MESDSSETNLVIITRRDRFKHFCKLYWRILVILIVPMLLLPVAFINSEKNAYICFYVFLIMAVYWLTDVLHPSVIAIVPIGISSVLAGVGKSFIHETYLRTELMDSLAVMMIVIAIEYSKLNRRIALKIILVFGCSHYRLSFLLFFICMFLAMWISSILACALMMPLVKAVLIELEKMGILEIYQTIGKARQKSNRHEQELSRPSDFTVFYFLGLAYSASIGGLATVLGSKTNQIFKTFCERMFPDGPKIEFPHFMLLNLPGVLVMETLLYLWMNFYFLGMFRSQGDIAVEIGMTEEEARYINTLISIQYQQMGTIKFHEIMVGTTVIIAALLQPSISAAHIDGHGYHFHHHLVSSSPTVMCAVLLFILPTNSDSYRFLQRGHDSTYPLPITQSKACLNWDLVRRDFPWSTLFIIMGTSTLFEALRDSEMTVEFEKFFLLFQGWPPSALALIVVLFCKLFSEFAPNASVVFVLLPSVAKVAVKSEMNPHYLMMAATLASSLPFHLVAGGPVNAMVCAYVHIPPWKMMYAGLGPSVISIIVVWFTVAVWSTVVWTDINVYQHWAEVNVFN